MTLLHTVSRLVTAANRHGVFVAYPKSAVTLTLDEPTRDRLRAVLPDEKLLERVELTTPDVAALTAALNRAADAARRMETASA